MLLVKVKIKVPKAIRARVPRGTWMNLLSKQVLQVERGKIIVGLKRD
jgi:hypothetical protein